MPSNPCVSTIQSCGRENTGKKGEESCKPADSPGRPQDCLPPGPAPAIPIHGNQSVRQGSPHLLGECRFKILPLERMKHELLPFGILPPEFFSPSKTSRAIRIEEDLVGEGRVNHPCSAHQEGLLEGQIPGLTRARKPPGRFPAGPQLWWASTRDRCPRPGRENPGPREDFRDTSRPIHPASHALNTAQKLLLERNGAKQSPERRKTGTPSFSQNST